LATRALRRASSTSSAAVAAYVDISANASSNVRINSAAASKDVLDATTVAAAVSVAVPVPATPSHRVVDDVDDDDTDVFAVVDQGTNMGESERRRFFHALRPDRKSPTLTLTT